MRPIAWVRSYTGVAGKAARVFTTTLGTSEDLLTAAPRYLNYRAYTIFGGSTEIQTTILAKSMLGL
jgi:alkylation response protein AidB-like acyl-CoA dehydrogenase